MRIVLAVLFVLHGLAHGVGFAVPWKLIESEDVTYRTTLLSGHLDVGDVGIRLVGILWLLVGLAFVATGVGAWLGQGWWLRGAVAVAGVSLAMCVLGWPEARAGAALNVAILLVLSLGPHLGWLDV